MDSIAFTHASISAHDLAESVRFYTDVFGMEHIPSPDLPVPVEWLQCGDKQLHLFERQVEAPEYHHFAVHVDDFERVYRIALERDLFDEYAADGVPAIYELPDGALQTYIRDPSDNLVEVDRPDTEGLDPEIAAAVEKRSETVSQSREGLRSSLYTDP